MCVHTTEAILLNAYRNFNEPPHACASFWNCAGEKKMHEVSYNLLLPDRNQIAALGCQDSEGRGIARLPMGSGFLFEVIKTCWS